MCDTPKGAPAMAEPLPASDNPADVEYNAAVANWNVVRQEAQTDYVRFKVHLLARSA